MGRRLSKTLGYPERLRRAVSRAAPTSESSKICKAVYRALRIRGYGRIDLRVTPEGEIVILEANPNPNFDRDDEFAQSAVKAGLKLSANGATHPQARYDAALEWSEQCVACLNDAEFGRLIAAFVLLHFL